jgi:hypothetical protein
MKLTKQQPEGYPIGYHKSAAVPKMHYARVAVSYIGAMLVSNSALLYISYPTQVYICNCLSDKQGYFEILQNDPRYGATRSPDHSVLIGGLVFGKKYSLAVYVRVLLVTLGVVMFTMYKVSFL